MHLSGSAQAGARGTSRNAVKAAPPGRQSLGGSFSQMWTSTAMGCISASGGTISASSISMMPIDHTSVSASYAAADPPRFCILPSPVGSHATISGAIQYLSASLRGAPRQDEAVAVRTECR